MLDTIASDWMTPEEALTRFNSEEISLLDLNLPSSDTSVIRYGFRFGDIGFLVGEDVLSEVINDYVIFPMPNCSSWLAGLANVRGNLIPVYDLVKLFNLETESSSYKHLMIIDQGVSSVGVLLDKLPQSLDMKNMNAISHKAKLSSSIQDYIKTSYSMGDVVWLDIDHRSFFKSIRDQIAL